MSANFAFSDYSNYYDLLYQDKNYLEEVEYIDKLLKKYHCQGINLLELGSGTGKHGILLGQRGYQVTGIERSQSMLEKVITTDSFCCHQGDIAEIDLEQQFDAAIALFHVISYQTSNDLIQNVFSNTYKHLKPNGLFIFDVWYSPTVYYQRTEVRVKRVSNPDIDIIRLAEPINYPNENRVDVNYTLIIKNNLTTQIKIINECHSMRHFSIPEIQLIANITGFEYVTAQTFLKSTVPSEKDWSICFVLRK